VSALVLDPAASRITVHTFAEGLFSRLAHDLELHCGSLDGTASPPGAGAGDEGEASVTVPLAGITVGGVVARDGRVDAQAMAPSDRRDCLAKMRSDVFHAPGDASVRASAKLERGGSATLRITPPSGPVVSVSIRPALEIAREREEIRVRGSFDLSLAAIGSDVVKGPMGAFRVKDVIRVSFDLRFAVLPPAGQPA